MNKPIVPPQRSKSKKTSISKIAAEAAASFQNIPFSPGLDNRSHRWSKAHHHHHYKGFSGPLIPDKAATRRSNGGTEADQEEPTSPRVSCLGQIKQKKKKKKAKCQHGPAPLSRPDRDGPKGPIAELKKIFGVGRKSYARKDDDVEAPSLGQMRKFASSRAALADFDWTAPPEEGNGDDDDEVIKIPFSGPIFSDRPERRNNNADDNVSTRLDVKKEISLWKKRTMAQPKQASSAYGQD